MTTVVDARGLSCPQPVIRTRKAIEAGQFPIEVLVDTVTAQENVRRMSEKAGLRVRIEQMGEELRLVLEK
jgi:TusA-related sulfurtransferase